MSENVSKKRERERRARTDRMQEERERESRDGDDDDERRSELCYNSVTMLAETLLKRTNRMREAAKMAKMRVTFCEKTTTSKL